MRDQGRDRHYSPYDRRGGHSRREKDSEYSHRW
jgi:hypothetical protein